MYLYSGNNIAKGSLDLNSNESLEQYIIFEDAVFKRSTYTESYPIFKITNKLFLGDKDLYLKFYWETTSDWNIIINKYSFPIHRSYLSAMEYTTLGDSLFLYSKNTKEYTYIDDLKNKNIAILTYSIPDTYINHFETTNTLKEFNPNIIGDFSFYFVSNDNLDINIKTENTLCGSDSRNHHYDIYLKDINDNTIYFERVKSAEYTYEKSIGNLSENSIYKLSIIFDTRIKDCSKIESLIINTDKITTTNQLTLSERAVVYTKVSRPKTILLINPKITNGTVNVLVNDKNYVVSSKTVYARLDIGEYIISSDKPIILDGGNLSFSKNSFFEPFIFQEFNYTANNNLIPDFVFSHFTQDENSSYIKIPNKYLYNDDNLPNLSFILKNNTLNNDYMVLKKYQEYNYNTKTKLFNDITKLNAIEWETK